MPETSIPDLNTCDLARVTKNFSLIKELAADPDNNIRLAVACNPNTPMHILNHMLSGETDKRILSAIAGHKNAIPDMIPVIIANGGPDLYSDIASAHCIPDNIAEYFAASQPWAICKNLLCNPEVSSDIITAISNRFPGYEADLYLALNPKTNAASLRRIYDNYSDDIIKWYLARNKSTPSDILDRLSASNINYVACAARQTLKEKA